MDAYQRALASRPDFDRAMNQLVVALAQAGRGAEAVSRAEAWAAARPSDPDRLFTLGLAQSEQDVDAALVTLRRVVGQRPDHALAHYNLGLLLKRVDRIDDAIAAARRAAALDGRPEAHVALASLFQQQGDFAAAVDHLETAVAADRRAFDAWMMLASVRKARGDLPRAGRGASPGHRPAPRGVGPARGAGARSSASPATTPARAGHPTTASACGPASSGNGPPSS